MIYKLGELFCGAGGLAFGALSADIGTDSKIVHAWATDFDEMACKSYRHNICKDDSAKSVICQDVRNLNLNNLEKIDAFAYGFPCNDFSSIGTRKGFSGKFGSLYKFGINILEKFQPKFFVAENVRGLISIDKGKTYQNILSDMDQAGYKTFPHVYRCEKYGIPQTRHRLVIVGIKKDLPFEFKVPSCELYKNCDVSVKNALSNPPIAFDAFNHEMPNMSPKSIERLKYIKPGKTAYNVDLPPHLCLKPKPNYKNAKYKRLDPALPCNTILANSGAPFFHFEENRSLTNRERARIQSFPDDFQFFGTRTQVFKQIGLAVPCKLSKIIFEAILKTFENINYDSEPASLYFRKR